jgi:putative tryptophan/tyrosine transport system substrate-binding protein
VAIFGDRGVSDALLKANEEQARALGLQPLGYKLAGPAPDIEGAFAVAKKEGTEAVLLLEEPIVFINRKKIAQVAASNRTPTMVPGDWADVGGLIAYGTGLLEGMGRMSVYVDKILKGAKPRDLPVERLTRYQVATGPPLWPTWEAWMTRKSTSGSAWGLAGRHIRGASTFPSP